MFRRVVAAGGLVVAAAIAAGALTHPARSVGHVRGEEQEELAPTGCGLERWSIKTLTDRAARTIRFLPYSSSVDALRAVPNPGAGFATPRLRGIESSTYRARVRLVRLKLEPDRDIHLVVASPRTGRTMIAELPSSTCTHGAAHRLAMMRARAALVAACGPPARSWRSLRGVAVVTGVGFFDVLHGQNGVAPNGIELHPAVALRVFRCR